MEELVEAVVVVGVVACADVVFERELEKVPCGVELREFFSERIMGDFGAAVQGVVGK